MLKLRSTPSNVRNRAVFELPEVVKTPPCHLDRLGLGHVLEDLENMQFFKTQILSKLRLLRAEEVLLAVDAEDDGALVGCVRGTLGSSFSWLSHFALFPNGGGNGISKAEDLDGNGK